MLGYTANASAIELSPSAQDGSLDSTAVHAAVAFWVIVKLTRGELLCLAPMVCAVG